VSVRVRAVVARHHPKLPRFVIIPSSAIASWNLTGTTTLEGTINNEDLGRRNIKQWDDARWFIEIPEPLCKRLGVDVGDEVTLDLRVASEELPGELASLITSDAKARRAWESLTKSQQRMLRENVAAAKTSATRERRARKELGVERS
jgi:antitoxin component of MazEF toxin-antitoxin module